MLGTCGDKAGQQNSSPLPLIDGLAKVETCPDQTQLTRRYTERARSSLKKNRTKPFFLHLAHTMPQVPLHFFPIVFTIQASSDYSATSFRNSIGASGECCGLSAN